MDSRLLIEIYRQPTGELAAKFKHLQGDTEKDEEFHLVSEAPITVEIPEEYDASMERRHNTANFFDCLRSTAKNRLFPEYAPDVPSTH